MVTESRRLRRQFHAIERTAPRLKGPIEFLLAPRMRLIRVPLGLLLILGGLASVLPVLGLWMLPFGLLLLAVDIPFLRRPISALVIYGRRKISLWRRRAADGEEPRQP